MRFTIHLMFFGAGLLMFGCGEPAESDSTDVEPLAFTSLLSADASDIYASVRLTTDVDQLSDEDKKLIPLFIEAAKLMDEIFWLQAWGDRQELLDQIADPVAKQFAKVNYGPWDRMNDDRSFVQGIGPKPPGANFYPVDISKEEFEAWDNPHKSSLYTLIKRNEKGELEHVYYHEAYKEQVQRVSALLREAAEITENSSFKFYLNERAKAFETDRYRASDIAWLNLRDNSLDIIIGPIETYEDQLYGYKAAHECYVLVKDKDWSQRLTRYAQFLPLLQRELPVDKVYKQDDIGSNAQLNAYDIIYYAGDCNAGGKTIAVNLPNDIEIQQMHGTRRSQLKNAMRAKFETILVPISEMLIDPEQRDNITFDAFFANTMFHEVAHGLGIKNTINGKGSVREALKEQDSALEEGKADVLGLWMVTKLVETGEIEDVDLLDYYATFLAGTFRSVRFGASSAHGKANMLRFNYFEDKGAFSYNRDNGTYKVNLENMKHAVESLSGLILKLQGDGDYEGVIELMKTKGNVSDQLRQDLERVNNAGIPKDIVFEQGLSVLGLDTETP